VSKGFEKAEKVSKERYEELTRKLEESARKQEESNRKTQQTLDLMRKQLSSPENETDEEKLARKLKVRLIGVTFQSFG
jgi:predicted DNA binding CopG/RHH family protein